MAVLPKIPKECLEIWDQNYRTFQVRLDTYRKWEKQLRLAQDAGESLIKLHRIWTKEMQAWESVMAAWVPIDACFKAHGGDKNLIKLPDPPPPEPEQAGPPESNKPESATDPPTSGGEGSEPTSEEAEKHKSHRCGAVCKTVDHLCTRKTTNDRYCYQHV